MKIKFNIIASLYDYNPNLAAFMKPDMWKKCLDCIDELLNILFENPNIFIGENIAEDSESLANTDQVYMATIFLSHLLDHPSLVVASLCLYLSLCFIGFIHLLQQ